MKTFTIPNGYSVVPWYVVTVAFRDGSRNRDMFTDRNRAEYNAANSAWRMVNGCPDIVRVTLERENGETLATWTK